MITEKMKIKEHCKSAQKNILKLMHLQYALLLENGILKNEITLTIQILMSHRKPHHN